MKNKFTHYFIGVFVGSILGVLVHSYVIERDYKKYVETPLIEVKYIEPYKPKQK